MKVPFVRAHVARPVRRPLVIAASAVVLLAACDSRGAPEAPAAANAPRATTRAVDTARGEVAIDVAGPGGAVLLIPVFINGQGPFDFVLDTGATMTCLDETLATRLRLPPRFGQVGVGIGVGASGQVPIVRLDSLRAGGTSATQVSACVLDLAHLKALGPKVEGLLGLNFLKSYRVTLDFEKGTARLEKP